MVKSKLKRQMLSIFIIFLMLVPAPGMAQAKDLVKIENQIKIKRLKDVDQDFQIGDHIILDEYIPFSGPKEEFKEPKAPRPYIIIYVTGLPFFIMGLNNLTISS